MPPNCPAELCSCGGKEVASAQPAGPAVPAVPDVPVPSPGVANPSLTEAVADRASQHDAEQERFRKADDERVKAADAAREATEASMRDVEAERKKSGDASVKERDAQQKPSP